MNFRGPLKKAVCMQVDDDRVLARQVFFRRVGSNLSAATMCTLKRKKLFPNFTY
jgi:hypothetical protein